MTGGLTVLGEHTKPSPVLFNVPARHRRHNEVAAGSSFSAKFLEPTGLHPALHLTVSSARPPVDDAYCAIHAHFTLPKTIFADRYQLADDLFLQSKNLTALRYSSSPVDLEAPAYATKPWGSGVLLELAPPNRARTGHRMDGRDPATPALPQASRRRLHGSRSPPSSRVLGLLLGGRHQVPQ